MKMGHCVKCGKDISFWTKFKHGSKFCDDCGENFCEACYDKLQECDKCFGEYCSKCLPTHSCEPEEEEQEEESEDEDGEENVVEIKYSPDKKFCYLFTGNFSNYEAELDAISMLNSQGYLPVTSYSSDDDTDHERMLFRKKVTSEDGANK